MSKYISLRAVLALALAAGVWGSQSARTLAVDGTWTGISGAWSDTTVVGGVWSGGIVATGADGNANFTGVNIAAAQTINLNDVGRSIGNITFTDATTSSHDLTISGANTLTLDVTTAAPIINVTQSGRTLTISSVIAGNDGLSKSGAGRLLFGAANTYSGGTAANGGILDFAAVSLAGIDGGAGRNITVASGAAVRRNALDNAFLNRLVESANEITVMTGTTANNLDLSSSTGANLPNAFLGNWAGNGAKAEYSGTLTPASDNYRLGGTLSNGLLGIVGTNKLTGTQGLLVGGTGGSGIRVELAAANNFTGDTVINTGARLALGNNLALQNSALNVGAAGGNFSLSTGLLSGDITGNSRADSPTFGGLIGSRNLATVFSNGAGNNEQSLQSYQVLGFTLNTGTGASHAYSGVIANFARDTTITKSGTGTQELSGVNTYTGVTTINDGTLKIGNASALGKGGSAGASTGSTVVNAGGTLDLNGITGLVEPIVLNGTGFGGNGALVNNSGTPASIDGGLASVQITNGGIYGAAPTVTISGTGTGATATVTRGLTNATITAISGGSGFVVGDQFTVSGGGGSGAVYEVTSVSSGAITGYNIVHAGTGYTSAPTGITRLTGNGNTGGATPVVVSFNATNFTVSGITLTNAGSGYDNTTTASFSSGSATALVPYSAITLAADSSIGGSGDISVNTFIAETGGPRLLTKVGAGTLTLTGASTYTGGTTISAGTLLANNASGSATGTGLVTISGGTFGGFGVVTSDVVLNNGGTLSPGTSIESLGTGSNTWNGGGTFDLEFSTDGGTGTAGVEWDLLAITGSLDLSGASAGNQVILNLFTMANATTTGPLGTWNPNVPHTWAGFVTTTGGVTGFASNKFNIVTTQFQNALNGTFNVSLNGNNLDLNYVPIPEPSSLVLFVLGMLSLWRLRRGR